MKTKTISRSNNRRIHELTSRLLKKGIRVYVEPVTNGGSYISGYKLCLERKLSSGDWGRKHTFEKEVRENQWVDAYVKTIEHVFNKEMV